MHAIAKLGASAFFLAAQASLHDAPAPAACVPTEQALRAVAHDEVHTAFVDDTALLSFRRHWTLTHQPSGASFRSSSRMTEVLVCRGGRWNILAVPGDQLLPAKSDSFFTRGLSIEERFVRDRGGRVSGIVYTMGDTEIEA